jgi:hypothetical protein
MEKTMSKILTTSPPEKPESANVEDEVTVSVTVRYKGEMARNFRLMSQLMEGMGRTPPEVVAYLLYAGVNAQMVQISAMMGDVAGIGK